MGSEPSVCAVMLTANRPEMARRAIECFRRQTYQNKRLLIWDSGQDIVDLEQQEKFGLVSHVLADRPRTIGELRNEANSFWTEYPILIHWDDDDWSHPNRISEQVALLQSSGAEAVGYREMLFWREPQAIWHDGAKLLTARQGEAWLYSNRKPSYALGTSLTYWRTVWQRRPFEPLNDGEDTAWLAGVRSVGISGLGDKVQVVIAPWDLPGGETGAEFISRYHATCKRLMDAHLQEMEQYGYRPQPRMIASIHGANTSPWYRPELMRASQKQGGEWRRVSEWDDHCRGIMTGSTFIAP